MTRLVADAFGWALLCKVAAEEEATALKDVLDVGRAAIGLRVTQVFFAASPTWGKLPVFL